MVKSFHQVIYCHPQSNKNTFGITKENLINGSAFQQYLPLSQLGVRALPGTQFYINGGVNPVIIGFTGLFEIDLTNGGSITELKFDEKSIEAIETNDSAYLVVDMLGMGGN